MKRFFVLGICFMLAFPISVLGEETKKEEGMAKNAKSAILIEASTGEILYEKSSHEKLAPASMTKIMSMLIIVESIEKGIIKWDDEITVSENASSMGGSQILLETGEKMTVTDLFKGVAVASGNDAVVALAEAIAGSEEEFVKLMNNKVKELGLKDTVFKNPHGLDDANHYSTAYDMAQIARELVKHEKVLKFTSIYEDYLRKGTKREFWLVNTNKLVRFNDMVDGLKTGYTKEAGYCLTATSFKNNMRLISTVMGEESPTTRSADTTELLNYGYANYKTETVLDKNDIIDTISIDGAKQEKIDIVPTKEVKILTKKNEKIGSVTYDFKLDKVKLPIKKGDKIGNLQVKLDNKQIENIDVTVSKNIKKANLGELYWKNLKDILSGHIIFGQ